MPLNCKEAQRVPQAPSHPHPVGFLGPCTWMWPQGLVLRAPCRNVVARLGALTLRLFRSSCTGRQRSKFRSHTWLCSCLGLDQDKDSPVLQSLALRAWP